MSSADNTTAPNKALRINRAVPGVKQYFPLNEPKIGTPILSAEGTPQSNIPLLFTPLKIRDVEFKNRIFVAPMCQYSADDGAHTDWHFVHLGSFATRGVGAIIVEATAVVPEGRITPEDSGLWNDAQMEPLKRIVNFAHSQGVHIGIQLAHAGRKASTYAPWVSTDDFGNFRDGDPNDTASVEENGWPDNVRGPSDLPWHETRYPKPKALSVEEIKEVQTAFVKATERCIEIGFDFIELHFAHGYLGHSFLSPLANKRTDDYGGSLDNRMRFGLETAEAVRKAWPASKPLFARISATDWVAPEQSPESGAWLSWGIEQSRVFSKKLTEVGVDLIDTSSGGNVSAGAQITLGPGYQVPFAEVIRKDGIKTGAVGLITEPQLAEDILQEGKADIILLARELLRNANWPLYAAEKLGVAVQPPVQYRQAHARMIRKVNRPW